MKVLIWIGCLFGGSLLWTMATYAGIGGALPMIIIEGGAMYLANHLCKKYDQKHAEDIDNQRPTEDWICTYCGAKNDHAFVACVKCGKERQMSPAPIPTPVMQKADTENVVVNKDPELPKSVIPDIPAKQLDRQGVRFCRKCGFKLLPNSAFCSKCGTKIAFDTPSPTPVDSVSAVPATYNSVDAVMKSKEFNAAYNALNSDQLRKFFFTTDTKRDAARVVYSVFRLIGNNIPMSTVFEIYVSILSRLMMFHKSPAQIAVTLDIRYGTLLNEMQQYIFIAFTEAHMNGVNCGFYIQSENDVNRIKEIASTCMNYSKVEKTVSTSATYGYSPDTPICVQSIPAAYTYLDNLLHDDGEVLSIDRIGSVSSANGHLVDHYIVTVQGENADKEIHLYVDGYGDLPSTVAPQGFHLKN